MRRLPALVLATLAFGLAACGGDDDADPAAPAEPAASSAAEQDEPSGRQPKDRAPEEPGTEIVVAESQYGPMLFDAKRQAIYLFDKEESDAAECYGECAEAWPPVLTDGEPVAGTGAEAKLLGTTKREDGSTQVTYDGHPLYFYAHEGPGQVLCHGIAEYGGLWLVVQPNGEAAPA